MSSVSIPNRSAFRAQEVCEIASVQPYVLRGWEAEFPDLGAARTAGGPRVYRRADVERVLKLKHLIQVEGLTLSGARRRLEEEATEADEAEDVEVSAPNAPAPEANGMGAAAVPTLGQDARAHLVAAREGLQWILKTLDGHETEEFALASAPPQRSTAAGKRKKK